MTLQASHVVGTALRSMQGHKRILKAIENGDEDGVSRVIEEHLKTARDDIMRYVVEAEPDKRGR